MKLKFYVFCPNDSVIISRIIEAAASAGAGKIGNYSQCSFITQGTGHWKSEPGSHPAIGKVGEVTQIDEVKIEMECQDSQASKIQQAIQLVHPYEKVVLDFVELKEF